MCYSWQADFLYVFYSETRVFLFYDFSITSLHPDTRRRKEKAWDGWEMYLPGQQLHLYCGIQLSSLLLILLSPPKK